MRNVWVRLALATECSESAGLFRRRAPLGPALGRGIVDRFGIDPRGAIRTLHLLPERRPGLEIIHQEFGGGEGVAAMRGGRDDKDDVVAWQKPTMTMNDGGADERPSRLCLGHMAGDLRLGHAGIVFEHHGGDRRAGLVAPADSRESDDGADVGASPREQCGFRSDVEVRALQPYGCRHLNQPPVIGGKNATSLAPATGALALTWVRSMAVRMNLGFSNANAYSSPRPASQVMRSATVATPAGGSTTSSALPTRSRTQAKYRSFTLIPRSDAAPRHENNHIRYRASQWRKSRAASGRNR